MNKQEIIDNIAYPPTMTYNLNTLTPTKVLAKRVKLLPMDFFQGKRLLDVGCGKGYFSLYSSDKFEETVGIDVIEEYVNLCNSIAKNNNKFIHTTFRDFYSTEQFDKVFFGNVHHYMYRECKSWEWVHKLAALCTDEVLIEGPIDSTCPDIKDCMPPELIPNYTFENFMSIMNLYFDLTMKIPTVSYTPGRYIMRFKRKYNLPKKEVIYKEYKNEGNENDISFSENNPVSVNISSFSPISNCIYNVTSTGWQEEKYNKRTYNYFQNEKELLLLLLEHNIFLSKLGYYEIDFGTINFFNPSKIFFDKGGVMPIKKINNSRVDCLKILFKQSYNTFEIPNYVEEILLTKDSLKIEEMWKRWRDEIQ